MQENLSERLDLDLMISEEDAGVELMGAWQISSEVWYRVSIKHNSFAADPLSECEGVIITNFPRSFVGSKQSPCSSCQKPISISPGAILVGLRLL